MAKGSNVPATIPALGGEQSLNRYLAEIKKFPILAPEQEYMLAKRFQEHGDPEAAAQLVTSHLRLVAKIAMGANDMQTVRAFIEAEAYDGPSIIIAYSHCIAHGYDLVRSPAQQKRAIDSGMWPLYRFDPGRIDRGDVEARQRDRLAFLLHVGLDLLTQADRLAQSPKDAVAARLGAHFGILLRSVSEMESLQVAEQLVRQLKELKLIAYVGVSAWRPAEGPFIAIEEAFEQMNAEMLAELTSPAR